MPRSFTRLAVVALLASMTVPLAGRSGNQSPETGTAGNRLLHEKSPYLQLHAYDPVDWYPWGPDAFEKARREDKPIFLSIGYSTCHWCHVMRLESFANPAIAGIINASFVAIKVDREERPDVDRIYMSYVESVYSGGWPMTVFLAPDQRPFFGMTYLPPDDRNGEPGLRSVLAGITSLWTDKRDEVWKAASEGRQVMETLARGTTGPKTAAGAPVLDATYRLLRKTYDVKHGGFGGAPKFPRPAVLNFLMRYHKRSGAAPALDMVRGTLRGMARGGIRDHLGGGFHRYATDAEWHVPHFEKMLYDQAQLALTYTDAYQITKDGTFRDVAREILAYAMRDMRSAEGGFFSAEDADSRPPGPPASPASGAEAEEGAFYVWSAEEIRLVLGDPLAERFIFHYGIGEKSSVLHVRHTERETATQFKQPIAGMRRELARARSLLNEARKTRPRPARDGKVLVAWNGMMISALARAGQVFGDQSYVNAARDAARFIETRLYDRKANRLERRYVDGHADIDGMLEDYAFLIQGLLDLYEASFDTTRLSWAMRLQDRQDQLFWDSKDGGYFSTSAEAKDVLVRVKEEYDGPEPSGNSISAMNLLRLWQLTDRAAWRTRADALFRALSARLTRSGTALPQLAVALDFSLSKPRQIVVAGKPGAADTRAMLRLVHDRFMPNKILLLADGAAGQRQIARWLPTVGPMHQIGGKAAIYVCENYVCRLPTSDPKIAADLLDGRIPTQ